jgi:hypothetical protein
MKLLSILISLSLTACGGKPVAKPADHMKEIALLKVELQKIRERQSEAKRSGNDPAVQSLQLSILAEQERELQAQLDKLTQE